MDDDLLRRIDWQRTRPLPNLRTIASFLTLTLICLFGACQPFRPQDRPNAAPDLPGAYSLYDDQASPQDESQPRWWENFNDPELNRLVDQALAGNLSIQKAWARLSQARALAVQAGAGLYPELDATAGAGYSRIFRDGGADVQDYSMGLFAGYEVDLWGRVRSQKEAALLETRATAFDLDTAALTLAAEVARRWIGILSLRMEKALLEEQVRINRVYLELVELRFSKSMVSVLDVYQQRQVLEDTRSLIPLVEKSRILLQHELALLLGKPPQVNLGITRSVLPDLGALPPRGLPADLLAQRPDVQAAGARLVAVDWQVGAARAARLPALSLSAGVSAGDSRVQDVFDNWLANLAANLAAPILDGGRRAAAVDRQRARADEQLADYRDTVLTAVKEVEDALVIEEKTREYMAILQLQINAAQRALEEARSRYRKGLSDYLPVITQLLSVQRLEREKIQQQADLLLNRVLLHRALGGTWPLEPPENKGG